MMAYWRAGAIGLIAVLVAGLIIAGSAGYYFYKIKKNAGNQLVCTQEALLCPDGSYVGRNGNNQCKFNSCPNTGPYTGKLQQSGGDFRLIMESPEKTNQEVAYALPLQIKISNVLGQIVGHGVKVFGAFGDGNTFVVDHLEETDITTGDIKVGETAFINGVRITLNRIVSDSRCPINAECIRAGSVVANATLKSDTDSETRDIDSGKPPAGFDSFLVSITNIKPVKTVLPAIDPQSYILTFKVVSR